MSNISRSIFNTHALNQMTHLPDIPDVKLGVGSAEIHKSIPVIQYQHFVPEEAVPLVDHMKNMSHEDMQRGFMNGELSIDDFPSQSLFMGKPTEVF